MTQIVDRVSKEFAVLELQLDSGFLKDSRDTVKMANVILERLRINDDIVQIDEAMLPFDSREENVYCTLERCRSICQPEGIRRNSKVPTCDVKVVLSWSFLRWVSANTIAVNCCENQSAPKPIDAVIHEWNRIRILHRDQIETTIELLRWGSPIRLRWLNDTGLKHSVDLVLDELP